MIVFLVGIEIVGLLNLGLYVSLSFTKPLCVFVFIYRVPFSLLVYSLAVESCLPILGFETKCITYFQ